MTLPLGPRLIGQVEKSLNALLAPHLAGRLDEREWVTLRLAAAEGADDGLAQRVAQGAHFDDAAQLVAGLTARGLIVEDRLSAAGAALVADVQSGIDATVGPLWDGLDADQVAAAESVLNEVLRRSRAMLG